MRADYMDAVAIYPNGRTQKGYCKKTAVTNVAGALERLRRDWAAYVATEAEAREALDLLHPQAQEK